MPATMLRPLSLGELLDRTFSLYKENFLLFFGMMAWPSVLAVAMGLLNTGLRSLALRRQGSAGIYMAAGAGGWILLLFIVYWIVYAIALGATTFAVSDVYLGQNATIAGSFKRMRGRIWRLMRLLGFIGVQVFALAMVFAIMIGVLGLWGRVAGGVAILILIPLFIGMPVWIFLRNSVSVPALMLENLKAGAASERSIQLMKGNLGRAFLVILLTMIVTYTVMAVFQGPFMVAAIILATHGQPPLWIMALGTVMGGIGGALASPLLMIGLVLLYYDIRVRKEAFDLQLMMGPVMENVAGTSTTAATAPSV